jgi:hypothetical protein
MVAANPIVRINISVFGAFRITDFHQRVLTSSPTKFFHLLQISRCCKIVHPLLQSLALSSTSQELLSQSSMKGLALSMDPWLVTLPAPFSNGLQFIINHHRLNICFGRFHSYFRFLACLADSCNCRRPFRDAFVSPSVVVGSRSLPQIFNSRSPSETAKISL